MGGALIYCLLFRLREMIPPIWPMCACRRGSEVPQLESGQGEVANSLNMEANC
jgi:hypothetical protein